MQLSLKEEVHVRTTETERDETHRVLTHAEELVVEQREGPAGEWKPDPPSIESYCNGCCANPRMRFSFSKLAQALSFGDAAMTQTLVERDAVALVLAAHFAEYVVLHRRDSRHHALAVQRVHRFNCGR